MDMQDLVAAAESPSPKILLLLEGIGGEVWELMFGECGKLLLKLSGTEFLPLWA